MKLHAHDFHLTPNGQDWQCSRCPCHTDASNDPEDPASQAFACGDAEEHVYRGRIAGALRETSSRHVRTTQPPTHPTTEDE